MKKSPILFIAALAAAGLSGGFAARRILSPDALAEAGPTSVSARPASAVAGIPGAAGSAPGVEKPRLPRSVDTLETIVTADPAAEYARIALWLTTASEPEIAAYWEQYKGGARSVPVTDLIFINWTRRNPQAAIAAVSGSADDRYAWWSWAANDPAAALAAAAQAGDAGLEQVACGIGDFNPGWLLKHLDRIPAGFRDDALNRMRLWPAGQDPETSLRILKEYGDNFDEGIFKSLVRKDPWAALDWLKDNPEPFAPFHKDNRVDALISTVATENPEELERLAARMPAGETKRKLDQALFEHLLATDPAAAMANARAAEAPLIAAQRLGQIGLGLLATDPAKAFELASEILAANPGPLSWVNRTEYENGSTWSGEREGKANELMNALFAKDREKTLALITAQTGTQNGFPETLATYTNKWADEDLDGFIAWTDRQSGNLHQEAAKQIGYKLAGQGDYLEAIEWAKIGTPKPEHAYSNVLYQWQRADPEAATQWLENSDLTDETKVRYRQMLKSFLR